MNCCDEYCSSHGCNQGRDCPARGPAKVAKVKSSKPRYASTPNQAQHTARLRILAKWLNEEQTAPIDRQALARLLAWAQMADKPAAWVYPEFFEGIAKAGCWTAYAGDGFGQHPDGVERFPLYRGPWPARPQEPTVEDNSQDWRGMDGTTAYWLIQRHADGWPDIGKMMGEWLDANRAQPAQPQKPLTGGDERRHIICLCPDCTKPAQQQEPVYFCDYGYEGWGKVDAAMAAANLADGMTVEAYYTSPPAGKPLTAEQEVEEFEAWCYSVGLMQKSHGIVSISSQSDIAWKAWQARAAHGIKGEA